MAFTHVANDKMGTGASPLTVTYASTPTAGNLLLASVSNLTNATSSVVSDTNGNWVSLGKKISGTAAVVEVFARVATAAQPTAITATQSTTTLWMSLYEFSVGGLGFSSNPAFMTDGNNGSLGTGTTNATASITTTVPNGLVFATVAVNGAITAPSVNSSFTLGQQNATGAIRTVDAYQAQTGVGSFTEAFSWTTSRTYVFLSLGIKPGIVPHLFGTESLSTNTSLQAVFRAANY